MTNPIKPKDLYAILKTPRFRGLDKNICPLTVVQAPNADGKLSVVAVSKQVGDHQFFLRINSFGDTLFLDNLYDDSSDKYVIAKDENGDGIKNGSDAGDFTKLQEFLTEVDKFTKDYKAVSRCAQKFK